MRLRHFSHAMRRPHPRTTHRPVTPAMWGCAATGGATVAEAEGAAARAVGEGAAGGGGGGRFSTFGKTADTNRSPILSQFFPGRRGEEGLGPNGVAHRAKDHDFVRGRSSAGRRRGPSTSLGLFRAWSGHFLVSFWRVRVGFGGHGSHHFSPGFTITLLVLPHRLRFERGSRRRRWAARSWSSRSGVHTPNLRS